MSIRRTAAAIAVSALTLVGATVGVATPAHADTGWGPRTSEVGTQDTGWGPRINGVGTQDTGWGPRII